MIVIGVVMLPVFAFYQWKFSKYPIMPSRFLKNPAVIGAAGIGFFDFVRFFFLTTEKALQLNRLLSRSLSTSPSHTRALSSSSSRLTGASGPWKPPTAQI